MSRSRNHAWFYLYLLVGMTTITLSLVGYSYLLVRVHGSEEKTPQQGIIRNFTTPKPTNTPTPTPAFSSGGGSGIVLTGDVANPEKVAADAAPCTSAANVAVYKYGESKTGVPWQILAGIHYREGGCDANSSLVSGRPIGGNEPDVVAGEGCAKGGGEGSPKPLPGGGCGFDSLKDTAVYAGRHLQGKVASGNVNSTADAMAALRGYNGTGNDNCGAGGQPKVSSECFPCSEKSGPGDDHNYVMNYFDTGKHAHMCIIYCADYTVCAVYTPDKRPGAFTISKALGLGKESSSNISPSPTPSN